MNCPSPLSSAYLQIGHVWKIPLNTRKLQHHNRHHKQQDRVQMFSSYRLWMFFPFHYLETSRPTLTRTSISIATLRILLAMANPMANPHADAHPHPAMMNAINAMTTTFNNALAGLNPPPTSARSVTYQQGFTIISPSAERQVEQLDLRTERTLELLLFRKDGQITARDLVENLVRLDRETDRERKLCAHNTPLTIPHSAFANIRYSEQERHTTTQQNSSFITTIKIPLGVSNLAAGRSPDTAAYFLNLPLDITLMIFDKLEPEDIASVGLTDSKLWSIAKSWIQESHYSKRGRWVGERIVCYRYGTPITLLPENLKLSREGHASGVQSIESDWQEVLPFVWKHQCGALSVVAGETLSRKQQISYATFPFVPLFQLRFLVVGIKFYPCSLLPAPHKHMLICCSGSPEVRQC